MASDAKLLARATMTAGAGRGIDSRLQTVISAAGACRDPAGRMGAAGCRSGGDVPAFMTIDAGLLAVAGRTEPRVGARLVGMTREEPGAVEARQAGIVECETGGQRGHHADSVAGGAGALAVAARAEVARARCSNTMLAHEVTVVHEVILGERPFVRQIDVTAVAVAQRPLVAVLMAAEARRHRRQQRLGSSLGHFGVTAHTIAVRGRDVIAMREAKVRLRELDARPNERLTVAAFAGVLVVWPRVAPPARCVGREVRRALVACSRDADMTFQAVDSAIDVRPVLERVRRRRAMQSEDACARGKGERNDHREGEANPHRASGFGPRREDGGASSSDRARRTRASVS
jgi:hypothetical protein